MTAAERLVAVLDANVLYPAPLRDLLVRLAIDGQYQARWTDQILEECFRNLLANRPDLTVDGLARTRQLLNAAVRGADVSGYEDRIAGLELPDPDDRHVLAAALQCGARVIVTLNLDDFPPDVLAPLGVEAVGPDEFVGRLVAQDWEGVLGVVELQAAALKNPPMTTDEVFDALERNGLVDTVASLRARQSGDPIGQ